MVGNGEGSGSEVVGIVSSSSSLEEEMCEERGGEGGRRKVAGREEEEFFTLLDSTLHCESTPDDGREVCGVGNAALRPGRLRERIAAFRRYTITACCVNYDVRRVITW